HIPVCVISTEEARERSLRLGALSFLAKPVQTKEALERTLGALRDFISRPVKDLLVVAPDPARRERVLELIGNGSVQAAAVGTGQEALTWLRQRRADCVVLDPDLPDMPPEAFADGLAQEPALADVPLVVYAEKDLPWDDDPGLAHLARMANLQHA